MPETATPASASTSQEAEITAALGTRSVVLVGMMGAGKSTIGRRLSVRLRLPFLDADTEIEAAAGMSVPDIFEAHGEPQFRDGEARVIARRRCERNTRPNGRHMMTAPLKHSEPITVGVALAERAYDIVIGRDVLQSLGARVATLRPGSRVAIVTDRNVAKHWLEKTEASLSEAGIATSRIIVDEGEGSKTYAGLEQVSEALISAKIERNDLVVALGGGVIGDLAGFAAAILRRGVDLVQVPTSLLAQVDSSVGGKTGINSPQGKNLLGAFHQPLLVVADTAVLDTLPPRQFRAGYAEIAKYGVLGDEAFFAWLEANHAEIFAGGAT